MKAIVLLPVHDSYIKSKVKVKEERRTASQELRYSRLYYSCIIRLNWLKRHVKEANYNNNRIQEPFYMQTVGQDSFAQASWAAIYTS